MSHRSRLKSAGYYTQHNGVSHAALTKPAHERLVAMLKGYGNRLSKDHETALYALVGSMTQVVQGKLEGRWAFGLPTGMGKTKSVEAWVSTLHDAGLDHVSVAVAASKVEALCTLKRNLIALGVPVEKIGLIHTKLYDASKATAVRDGGPEAERYASEPSEGADRQFLLVTHQRVRGSTLETFNTFKGQPRDLLIYDESLIISDSLGISIPLLKGALGFLKGVHGSAPQWLPLIAYLSACVDCIGAELEAQKAGTAGGVVSLPAVTSETLAAFVVQVSRQPALEAARQLLEIATEQMRVIATGQGGVVWYQVSVPAEIKNVLILDASQPIRRLVHLDTTIKDAETHLPAMQNVGVPLSKLKSFDRVTINQMFAGGGRDSMGKGFSAEWAEDRRVVRDVVEVVKAAPLTEAVLIFTYKTTHRDRTRYRDVLLQDLERAGVDTSATVETPDGLKPRISVVTWGMETSLNDYAHCRHVILAGVLQRSPVDLAASYLGQSGTLEGDVQTSVVSSLSRSEVCHMAYQALSRGACRVVDNGRANAMTAHIIHKDERIRQELEAVMPGAVWCEWKPKFLAPSTGVMAALSRRIADHLALIPVDTATISTRRLKADMGVKAVPSETWRLALRRCLDNGATWMLTGRSLYRASAVFAG